MLTIACHITDFKNAVHIRDLNIQSCTLVRFISVVMNCKAFRNLFCTL